MAGVDLGSIVAHLKLEMNDFNNNLNKATDEVKGLSDKFRGVESVGKSLSSVGTALTAGITAPVMACGASVVKTQMQFQDAMANVKALSGATGDDLKLLEDTAKEMGETTVFSASECADALGYMALAGWDAQQSAAGLPGVLNLAAASGMELAAASDMVTDYLTAFGESADQAGRMADVLSYAQANSNTTSQMLGESFKNCAVNARNAGMDIEQTTAILGKLADSGLKGAESGTALNAVIRDMTQKMDNGSIYIGKTQVAVQDANGNFRKMTDIIRDVTKATEGMGDAEKTSAMMTTFTADSIKAMGILCNTGADSIDAFTQELYNSDGAAENMANTMNDTLSGALKELSSAWEGLQLSLFDSTGILTQLVKGLTEVVRWIKNLPDPVKQVVVTLAMFAAVVGPVILVLGKLIQTWVKMKTTIGVLKAAFGVLKSGILGLVDTAITYLYVFITDSLIPALSALWGVLMANPIILIVAALAALVAGFIYLWNNCEGFREFWINLWEVIKQAALNGWNAVVEFFTVSMPQWFNNVVQWFQHLPETIAYWLGYALGTVASWAVNLAINAYEAGCQFVENLINWLSGLPGRVWNWLLNTIAKAIAWRTAMKRKAMEAGTQFVTSVINFIRTLPGKVWTWLVNTINKVIKWVSDMKRKATEAGQNFVSNCVKAVQELPNKLWNIGANAINSLISGLRSGVGRLWDACTNIASNAVSGFKKAFKIGSPSKVMRDEVGRWIPEGITVGIKANADKTLQAIKHFSKSMVEEIDGNKFLGQVNMATSGINITNENDNDNVALAVAKLAQAVIDSRETIDYDKMSIAFKRGAQEVDSTIVMDKTVVGKKTAQTVKERSEYLENQQSRFRGDVDYV